MPQEYASRFSAATFVQSHSVEDAKGPLAKGRETLFGRWEKRRQRLEAGAI